MAKLYLNIRLIMVEKKMKPKQLAELVGMSERSLYYIFEDKKCPTMLEMERFAAVLDVGIEDLYDSPYKHKREK